MNRRLTSEAAPSAHFPVSPRCQTSYGSPHYIDKSSNIFQLISHIYRPPAARVSGVVQESPGTLEYEVALYREATQRSEDGLTVDIQDEIPVDQAVPIGTKLQLRATINDNSGM